jgi:hypothetical protein
MPHFFIETNTLTEVTKSLEFAADRLPKIIDDTYEWKWIILAVHSCLQNIMVAAIEDSMGYNIQKPGKRSRKWLNALYDNKYLPNEELKSFLQLYNDIKSDEMEKKYDHSRKFISESRHDESMKILHDYRTTFAHFISKMWERDVDRLPNIIEDCLEVCEFLTFKSNNVIDAFEDKPNIEKAINDCRNKLIEIKNIYNSA